MSDAPEIVRLNELLCELPHSLSWEDLWNFRSKVGELMVGTTNSETCSTLKTIYDKFTVQLKERAEELGKGKEFAEAERLTQLMLETERLRADLNAADSGLKFHAILNDPERQVELSALSLLIEAGGVPANYLTEKRDSLQANYRIAKSGQTGGPIGLKDVFLAWIERFKWKRKQDRK
jgi:hypothetical protein